MRRYIYLRMNPQSYDERAICAPAQTVEVHLNGTFTPSCTKMSTIGMTKAEFSQLIRAYKTARPIAQSLVICSNILISLAVGAIERLAGLEGSLLIPCASLEGSLICFTIRAQQSPLSPPRRLFDRRLPSLLPRKQARSRLKLT